MDFNDRKANSIRSDDTSLGLLNMDSLKGRGRFFGDLSHDFTENRNASASNGVDRRISDRLNMERKKALEALQKSDKSDLYRRSPASSNKENMKSVLNNASRSSSIPLDRTDYVPLRRPHTINISDLVTDETINLETTSSCPPSAAKDTNISFEPSEMTGRSTLYKKDLTNHRSTTAAASSSNGGGFGKTKSMSVSDILASSFAQKARNLCDTLNGGDCSLNMTGGDGQVPGLSLVSTSTACSSFSNYNNSKSLPRTADLSKASYSRVSFTGDAAGTFSFNCGAGACEENDISSENFAPGELMQSKLILDEISWAQEYAAIPAATLSEEAKVMAAERNSSQVNTNGFEPPSASNSIIAGDPNFSLGNFFHMRSENIWDMVKSKSPDKCRTPFALVEDDTSTGTVSTSSIQMETISSLVNTPKVDNKTYTRVASQVNQCQESKDSGNSSDNSYLLSVSAIDKALTSLERDSCISGYNNSNQLFMLTKKSKSCMNPQLSNTQAADEARRTLSKATSLGPDIMLAGAKSNLRAVSEIILENKENLDPEVMRGGGNRSELSDTLSFTESILNSSDMKQMQHSDSQQRSPLSPIEVRSAPNIRVTEVSDGEEADNDEWPGTPVQNPNRRIRRTKSPHIKTPLCANAAAEDSPDATTPINSRPSRSYIAHKTGMPDTTNRKEPKSLCSTRLDGERNDCDLGISPNLSGSKTSGLLGQSNTLTNISPGNVNMENSPLSTTSRNYHLSQTSSPTPSNLDTTSNSDRQLFTAGGAQKVVSSPVGSESSSTCSYATMHGTRSAKMGSAMRSISRCSSTSEFSHRDGKPIPLKVTAFELSWGSVKLRSDSRKSMQIKNIISKRLVIRVEISGPGFQIVNNQRSNNITLQSQECRTISISFCPTVPGVAIGKLAFFAPKGASTMCQSFIDVPLYGYGGSANVMPQKVTVGPVGSPFITMGDICDLANPLQRTVRFQNKGPLLAFAVITIDSLGLMLPRISDAFEIQPQKVLIPSRSSVDVQILFKPKREEIKKILKKIGSVLALATLRVICGDEANRQRIRRLLVQMNERERSKMSSSTLDMLWTTFPGEEEMRDLAAIRESPNNAMDLAAGCRVHEIVLTINRENFDETAEASSLFLPDADETVLFRTVICAADSNSPTPPTSLGTVSEMYEENAEDEHGFTGAAEKKSSWSVKPSFVEINLKRPEHISLFVYNGFKSRQYFEVACSSKNLLRFSPSEGYVAPDNGRTEIVIEINVNADSDPQEDVFIMVNMENERIMVPVKIHQ